MNSLLGPQPCPCPLGRLLQAACVGRGVNGRGDGVRQGEKRPALRIGPLRVL